MDYAPLSDREEKIGEAIVDAAKSLSENLVSIQATPTQPTVFG